MKVYVEVFGEMPGFPEKLEDKWPYSPSGMGGVDTGREEECVRERERERERGARDIFSTSKLARRKEGWKILNILSWTYFI